jgi:hypothetical protein
LSIRVFDPNGSAVRLVASAAEREGDLAMPFLEIMLGSQVEIHVAGA